MRISEIGKQIAKGGAKVAGSVSGVAQGAPETFARAARKIDISATNALASNNKISSKMANRLGATAGASVYGSAFGAVGGGVIGGIAGGIDDDESFLSGMGKGALIGAGVGGLAGGASGYFHNESDLIKNITGDYRAVAARIVNLNASAGESINNAVSNNSFVVHAQARNAARNAEVLNDALDYWSGL